MAKRKKLKNVKISEQELTPTVIGYLNEKGASPLFLIIVFGILFIFLYYLPEINVYVEQKRGNVYNNNVPSVSNNNEEEFSQNDAGKEFAITDDVKILLNEITLSEFNLEENVLSFKVKNNSNKIVDLSQNEYYLYLKDSEGVVNETIKLDDLVILENSEQELSFEIVSVSVSKIIIDTFKEDYISEISLVDNKLTCSLDDETYIYEFNNNEIIFETYIYEVNDASESLIYKYQKQKERYEEIEGVEINLSSNFGLFYEIKADLSVVDIAKLNDDNLFEKDMKAKIIKFKMEDNGYSCS